MVSVRRVVLGSVISSALFVSAHAASAQQANDVEYTAKIRELTPTDPNWKFTTELVDHLPVSGAWMVPVSQYNGFDSWMSRARSESETPRGSASFAAIPR